MKSAYAMLIAVALGAAGALLNWNYLHRRGQDIEELRFVGIKKSTDLRPGDIFRPGHLVPVPIPKNKAGNLTDFAFLWNLRHSVIGMPVTRRYLGGELVMQSEIKSPSQEGRPLEAGKEDMIGVPVDTRTFVSSLCKAGDWVSFTVPRARSTSGSSSVAVETIGKFEVWAVGDRTSSSKVARAAKQSHRQQNVLQIVILRDGAGYEKKAQRLYELLAANVRGFIVTMHPPDE